MGNVFKSIALVAALAAGDATHAQEGADSTANRTKQALVELLSELPPGFDSARRVIEWDITLAADGDLSDSDQLAIESHMWKLATVIPESARKVREAMTGVGTIVAADQVAALNESAEERKEREKRERLQEMAEKSADNLNNAFLEDRNWKFAPKNTLAAKIKRNWRSLEIEWDEKNVDPTHEAKVDLVTVLAPGSYDIVMTIESWSPLSLYIYDGGWKPLDMKGNIVPPGVKKSIAEFVSGVKTSISIPENCRSCMFQGRVTTQDRNLIISDFVATGVLETDLAQNK